MGDAVSGRDFTPSQCDAGVHVLQERSDRAQKIINVVKKKRGELVKGMERLCDAYITLAYMDASKHKAEKSEHQRSFLMALSVISHGNVERKSGKAD